MLCVAAAAADETQKRISLKPSMVTNEAGWGNPAAIVDEQDRIGDPPSTQPATAWETDWRHAREFPASAYLDLGSEYPLAVLWLYDINDVGTLEISAGRPGNWRKIASYETRAYRQWVRIPLDVSTRYLRLTRLAPGCLFSEIALYAYTEEGWKALQQRKAAEARAAEERRAALVRAEEEAKNRPLVDMGPLFGRLPLVDEIDCAAPQPGHMFIEGPAGCSQVQQILTSPCRVVAPRSGEASFISFRVGRYKLLKPGAAYLLTVEYPEDEPRSMMVMNGGCETVRGFHTGPTVGDALRAKYVWSNPESLRVPLSGRWETWKQVFFLHDRFPKLAFIRGAGLRELTVEDGFPVTIAQYSAENDPPSRGLAVRRIRLLEIPDPAKLTLKLALPPAGLPRRHIFWREEMADGVIDSAKPEERGLARPLDWYVFKAGLMKFLGINTFTKDLLEFGACQHWDSTPGGGHDWVFFAERHKDLWGQIVELMGREGFDVLPYYEYAGSRGYKGIGHQRRAKPLTRDDAYTHIKWIESSNADITDPDTIADFRKMLDLTIVRYRDKARFVGAWIRPRMQLPISFGDGARQRFAAEANGGQPVTRQQLINDRNLLQRYYDWWFDKRKAFLEAARDHLRNAGVNPDAVILFTADASEPGPSFPWWDRRIVTDDPAAWSAWLKDVDWGNSRPITPLAFDEVLREGLYMKALLSPPLDWGKWEVSHASPAADPHRYAKTPGVLLTHGFNRAYTVSSPRTFDAFRGPSGLAIVRHYALNEHMIYDKNDKEILGYYVADVERAGPYCMMAEALAMANGDPTHIGYLVGSCFNRGFPEYVRDFNAAFLSLPALPSRRLDDACADREIVVRIIETAAHGCWLAVVNTGWSAKSAKIILPRTGSLSDAVTGAPLAVAGNTVAIDMAPCQLRALRLAPAPE